MNSQQRNTHEELVAPASTLTWNTTPSPSRNFPSFSGRTTTSRPYSFLRQTASREQQKERGSSEVSNQPKQGFSDLRNQKPDPNPTGLSPVDHHHPSQFPHQPRRHVSAHAIKPNPHEVGRWLGRIFELPFRSFVTVCHGRWRFSMSNYQRVTPNFLAA